MTNPKPNYWRHRIYRQSMNGTPILAAVYLSETHVQSIEEDLRANQSHLRGYLERYFGIDPRQFAKQHQLNAQALLGGLVASEHCALHFGIWVPVEPPPAQAVIRPDSLGSPSMAENGVRVWLEEHGNTNLEV